MPTEFEEGDQLIRMEVDKGSESYGSSDDEDEIIDQEVSFR